MLKNIFIPEKINNYYIFPQRIIGLIIHKQEIHATQLLLSGNTTIFEKFISQPIALDETISIDDRIKKSITELFEKTDPAHSIRTALPSGQLIFKELTVPFTQHHQIKIILNYEIEPYLPFSLDQAVIDFIITKTYPDQNKADILVAAVQKEYIAQHLSLFETKNFQPTIITVDLFCLYGLFMHVPAYQSIDGAIALIDGNMDMTRILFIHNTQLKFVRVIPHGIRQIIKHVAKQTSISDTQAHEELVRFGFEKHNDQLYTNAIEDSTQQLINGIFFTINSYVQQINASSISKLIMLGNITEIPEIARFLNKKTGIDCTTFNPNDLLDTSTFGTKKNMPIPLSHSLSVSIATPNGITDNLNLRQREFALTKTTLINQQIFSGIGVICLIFIALVSYSMRQTQQLKKEIRLAEYEVVEYLQNNNLTDMETLDEAIEDTNAIVSREESIWFAFSAQTDFSFLKYLQDLSSTIDKKATGLKLNKLVLTNDTITIEGSVRDYDGLKTLERELKQSQLFKSVPTLQETNFGTINLEIYKDGKESYGNF